MASMDLTASATFPDGTEDPDAQFAWSIDDETVAVVSAAGNVATVLAQAAGSANVTVVATNPDGSSVSASVKVVITLAVATGPDAVAVAITAGAPANDDQFDIALADAAPAALPRPVNAPLAPAPDLATEGVNAQGQRVAIVDGVERVIG